MNSESKYVIELEYSDIGVIEVGCRDEIEMHDRFDDNLSMLLKDREFAKDKLKFRALREKIEGVTNKAFIF